MGNEGRLVADKDAHCAHGPSVILIFGLSLGPKASVTRFDQRVIYPAVNRGSRRHIANFEFESWMWVGVKKGNNILPRVS